MADATDILKGLEDIRLPATGDGGALADAAAAFAIGLAIALLAVMAARLFLTRPPSRRAAVLGELERSRGLAPAERLLAQARLLQRLAAAEPRDTARRQGRSDDAPAEDWPGVLDRRFGTTFFTSGPGAALRDALYRPAAEGRGGVPAIDPGVIDRELVRLLSRVKG